MAKNQTYLPRGSSLDTSNSNNTANFLPEYYRSDSNKKFLHATINQLTQPGMVKKVNGFIGRLSAKATTADDIFINAPTSNRQNYQLEPGLVINDTLDNTVFLKDYLDYINQLKSLGANASNHSRINSQEFYSWDPHICWDKFVNFQDYYWLPNGPDVITISNSILPVDSTYTVELDITGADTAFVITPDGLTRNQTITLYRGQTYQFEINSPNHPFSFKTIRSAGPSNRYNVVSKNAVTNGIITFEVPLNSPDILYYVSENDVNVGGMISMLDISERSFINVENEIIGKKAYKLPNGVSLSNGMCVEFKGEVVPAKYATGKFHVNGVGEAIKLIANTELEIASTYTTSELMLFEVNPFDSSPFSNASAYASKIDYIVINQGSVDKNPWSRYNKWVHKDVIEISSTINKVSATLDQTYRAVRPIIEFTKNLKLFNFGTHASTTDINLIDKFTTDVFSTIEGSRGYIIDGIPLTHGQRVVFTADLDPLVTNNVFRVEFIDVLHIDTGTTTSRQIRLVRESSPVIDQVILVKDGISSQGKMYWYNGITWVQAQQKTSINQMPLFDVVDENGISFGDDNEYSGTTFTGTSIFSYKVGTGTADTKLGFPLSYKNINNIGDIMFNFELISDTFQYEVSNVTHTKKIDTGFLVHTTDTATEYVNGWLTCDIQNTQPAVRVYRNSNKTNNFNIDIFDTLPSIDDIEVRVYVNGMRVTKANTATGIDNWSVISTVVNYAKVEIPMQYHQVVFTTPVELSDVITIKVYSNIAINSNGYYEVPINLQHNPLNGVLTEFTLGEVIDHVDSIVDNIYLGQHNYQFVGVFPGAGNLRDLGKVSQFGTKFVQHSGPISLSMYHLTSDNNIIRAIEKSRDDYGKFKKSFMVVATSLGINAEPKEHVDLILRKMNSDVPITSPYYFSDMIPYGAFNKTDFTVRDPEINIFSLSKVFTLTQLSTSAVLVYLNHVQLLHDTDYTFNDQGFIEISAILEIGDIVSVYEYNNTDGCLIPETPTKLGLWPKYTPKIFKDTTLVTPRWMIQGHDGSLTLIYGYYDTNINKLVLDYRDELLLELEKRIYNNIKVTYDTSIFDIHDVIPSYHRKNDYTLAEFNQVLISSYINWAVNIKQDFSTILSQDKLNPFLFNYRNQYTLDDRSVPGFWRGIYQWMYGTDRPHMCPWEMLGFSEEPKWWTEVYGPAPYTNNNIVMWTDISNGLVKEPNTTVKILTKFVRPYLLDHLPVNENGVLISPRDSNVVFGRITETTRGDFKFGDVSPVEAAWRRSSYYAFSVIKTAILLAPSKTIGVLFDRSRIVRNLTNQLVYLDTGIRINLKDIAVPSIYLSSNRVQTAGLVNYLINYIDCTDITMYNQYKTDLMSLTTQLCYRVSGFTSKEKFKLLLESRSPSSTGNIFIPQEDYKVVLNTSSPISVLVYSGVIITKIEGGFEIKGYSITQPYFKYYTSSVSGSYLTIGGVSAAYTVWASGQFYLKDRYVKYQNRYYNTIVDHVSSDFFDFSKFVALVDLPITGGEQIEFKKQWDKEEQTLLYGTKLFSIQSVVDFLVGYGQWLSDQGFNFNDYNIALGAVSNWETSAKEFVFWTVGNWGIDQQVWSNWAPDTLIQYNEVVRYNGDYYKALRTTTDSYFNEDNFLLLPGLDTDGNSVITLSPAATTLVFSTYLSVVDDITKPNYVYEMFDVNGNPILPQYLNSYRTDNLVSYTAKTDIYIYCASFYLVQKEHVVVLNNTTMFNDTIYNPESGYKQDKIKVSGYVSTQWNGSVNVPGFIVDSAIISEWVPWKDYALGEVVKHRTFYYSALTSITGTLLFDELQWTMVKQPTPKLLPNWNYKASQFTDFYSLDSDNFDIEQQRMAQHLVGYQKRQYLENIIQDDVSEFKFYQGMIIEKGTHNVLNKLFDVLSSTSKESLTFFEEWAVRSGVYGASSAFNTVEFTLEDTAFRSNPQGFQLVDARDRIIDDRIIRLLPSDLYIKPLGYTSKLWPENKKQLQILRSCGHVKSSEVLLILKSLDDLQTTTTKVAIGDYVWCTFVGTSWNVYRFVKTSTVIKNMKIDTVNRTATFICVDNEVGTPPGTPHDLSDGDYIQIVDNNIPPDNKFNLKFFKVSVESRNSFTISVTTPAVIDRPALSKFSVNVFSSRRYTNTYEIPYNISGTCWTDNYETDDGFWATWSIDGTDHTLLHKEIEKPDITTIKQAFLYNKVSNQLVKYLDVVDSINGKNPSIADRELKFKSFYDPAVYSDHDVKITNHNGINVDNTVAWTTDQIGVLWWDLRTTKFIESYDDDIVYRTSSWSKLAYGASVDVYEWVESKMLPSKWDALADTDVGLTTGISGTSLYGDSYYSKRSKYDNLSQRYTYTYYFWVKGKVTVPAIPGRNMSALNVSSLIANPRGTGYPFLALTGLDSFSLVNVESLLTHADIILTVEYWLTKNTTQNMHTQWKVISKNENTTLPTNIEEKWFDSLCGYDMVYRAVPDNSVPVKLRYGIENRPRQSMFVNRCEVLKQFIEQTNLTLLKYLIVDIRNISNLLSNDPIPNINRGLYDAIIDTDLELRLTVAKSYINPVLSPVLDNGKIIGINIDSPGRGYLVAPYATIEGSGSGALIRFTIGTIGEITGCDIIRSGEGYTSATVINARNYSVLIRSDSTSGNGWGIYEYNRTTELWNKTLMQTYDTRKYWEYVDWYAVGYDHHTAINYTINTYAELATLDATIGETVNIRTTNSNRWVLLKKYAETTSFDWSQSYQIIGSENGTIQFSSTLYDFKNTPVGYEGLFYDQGVYDNSALVELRMILNAIKHDLFIDDLKSEYLELFFTCVRSALSEQTYVDWIFKTSFVNVMHNVGVLRQSVTYKNDNLSDFESYVSEVKPYRTQIREYVSLYDAIDNAELLTSDFDVPAEFSSLYIVDDGSAGADESATYPTKSWYDNVGFSVIDIKVIDGGAGYKFEPTVSIVKSGNSGDGATARAYIANGKVSRITVVTSGLKYLAVPTIKIDGGLNIDGRPAVAIAILGNSVVRSNLISLKFDRIESNYVTSTLDCIETFAGTGAVQFKLAWAPDITIGKSSVLVNGVLQLRDSYTIAVKTVVTTSGYNLHIGSITFETAPSGNIEVKYIKDVSLLSAVDRIQYYYNPQVGDLGKDLAQLMTGIEYNGVTVSGLTGNTVIGWGSNPFYTDTWDSFRPSNDDYQVMVARNTHSIKLPYIPALGSILNVYYSNNYITRFNTDGKSLVYRFLKYENIPTPTLHKVTTTSQLALTDDTVLELDSIANITVGDVVSNTNHKVWTTKLTVLSTDSTTNYITIKDTSLLYEDMPIYFIGKSVGGIQDNYPYLVSTIHSSTQFSISQGGTVEPLTTDSGNMIIIVGEFKFNTTVVSIDPAARTVVLSEPISTYILSNTEITFSRPMIKYQDFSSIARDKLVLKTQIAAGMIIELTGKSEIVRIDDVNYGGAAASNINGIMPSFVADGVTDTITIPTSYYDIAGNIKTFTVEDGNIFIIRNSTSSGADTEYDIDTAITGGNFAFNSAAGITASEIIIDGSTLVNQDTDAGPEEVVPGHLVDAVAIKIYDNGISRSYMQFKDMLNRTHIKRLNANKQTTLAVELHQTDETIEVVDASSFDLPSPEQNKPGVLDVNGERIEFFTINGNVLGQLRRGTLGTGVPYVHPAETSVQELSTGETMPHQDKILINQYESDGTPFVNIAVLPVKSNNWSIKTTALAVELLDTDLTITVTDPSIFKFDPSMPNIIKIHGESIEFSSINGNVLGDLRRGINSTRTPSIHKQNSVVQNITTESYGQCDNLEVIVNGVTLKKSPYQIHDINVNAASPMGDIQYDADFSVDGKSKRIRLTNAVPAGTFITVIKRTGFSWDTPVYATSIERFLNGAPGSSYTYNASTFNSDVLTFDDDNTRF